MWTRVMLSTGIGAHGLSTGPLERPLESSPRSLETRTRAARSPNASVTDRQVVAAQQSRGGRPHAERRRESRRRVDVDPGRLWVMSETTMWTFFVLEEADINHRHERADREERDVGEADDDVEPRPQRLDDRLVEAVGEPCVAVEPVERGGDQPEDPHAHIAMSPLIRSSARLNRCEARQGGGGRAARVLLLFAGGSVSFARLLTEQAGGRP